MPKLDLEAGTAPAAVTPDDPSPVSEKDRLREAFTQLLLQNGQRHFAVPAEGLWRAQARQQGLNQPPPPLGGGVDSPQAYNAPGTGTPMPRAVPQEGGLDLPVGPMNPAFGGGFKGMDTSTNKGIRDRVDLQNQLHDAEKGLFKGKGQFAGPYKPDNAYSLPKSEKKKGKEKARG